MKSLAISEPVLAALSASRLEGHNLYLSSQLERGLYEKVAKVIIAAGGKWDRKAGAHVFAMRSAEEAIDPILLTGTVSNTKQDFGQFDTPPEIVAIMMDALAIEPGATFLEPSCGIGNIALEAEVRGAKVAGIEVDTVRAYEAKRRCYFDLGLKLNDFLYVKPEPVFDYVGMNPPFARQADIIHVIHALSFLKRGGRLAAIMSAGITFRQDRQTVLFRELLEQRDATIEKLSEGAFKEAGTMVNSVLVWFDL